MEKEDGGEEMAHFDENECVSTVCRRFKFL